MVILILILILISIIIIISYLESNVQTCIRWVIMINVDAHYSCFSLSIALLRSPVSIKRSRALETGATAAIACDLAGTLCT